MKSKTVKCNRCRKKHYYSERIWVTDKNHSCMKHSACPSCEGFSYEEIKETLN